MRRIPRTGGRNDGVLLKVGVEGSGGSTLRDELEFAKPRLRLAFDTGLSR